MNILWNVSIEQPWHETSPKCCEIEFSSNSGRSLLFLSSFMRTQRGISRWGSYDSAIPPIRKICLLTTKLCNSHLGIENRERCFNYCYGRVMYGHLKCLCAPVYNGPKQQAQILRIQFLGKVVRQALICASRYLHVVLNSCKISNDVRFRLPWGFKSP